MSWEANKWANDQRLRLPQEQLVLVLIANAADPDGLAFAWWKKKEHWWTYLAEHGRQSRASIFRHLKMFEELGLMSREIEVAADGSKRFRAQLHLDKFVNLEIREQPIESGNPSLTGETDLSLTSETDETETQSQSCDSIRVQLEDSKEVSISPQTPLSPETSSQPVEPDLTGLNEFRATYPRPSSKPEFDAELWASFDQRARDQVQHGAAGARIIHERNPKSSGVVGPTRFLQSEPLWAEYGRFAPSAKAPPPPRRFVAKSSDEWRARTVLAVLTNSKMPDARHDQTHGCDGADFLGHLPAGGLVLAQYTDQFGNVDLRGWVELHATSQHRGAEPTEKEKQDRPKIAAWIERVAESTGIRIAPGIIFTEGMTEHIGADGKPFKAQRRFNGLRVPAPWPPAKGSTDPPPKASAA